MRTILEKRAVGSFSPLLESNRIPIGLRGALNELFGEFIGKGEKLDQSDEAMLLESDAMQILEPPTKIEPMDDNGMEPPEFSDDEETEAAAKENASNFFSNFFV